MVSWIMTKAHPSALGGAVSELQRFEDQPLRARFLARSIGALAKIVERLDKRELATAMASPSAASALFTALTQPGAIEILEGGPLTAARLRGVQARDALLAAEGGTLASDDVAELLRISRQAVDKRRASGKLLAVELGRRGFRYPAWQFGDTDLLPGMEETLKLLDGHPPIAQMRFFLSGDHALGGERPLDLLRRGDLSQIRRAARVFGQQRAV